MSTIHELNGDSKGMYDIITTLLEGKDYKLRQTIQRIRDSFDLEDRNRLLWVQGRYNIADALTK